LADNDDILNIEQTFGGNDNWEEPVSIGYDFSIEEILDIPTESEIQINLPNTDCGGQNELSKKESHSKCNHELFCVTGKDSELISIDNMFDESKSVV